MKIKLVYYRSLFHKVNNLRFGELIRNRQFLHEASTISNMCCMSFFEREIKATSSALSSKLRFLSCSCRFGLLYLTFSVSRLDRL